MIDNTANNGENEEPEDSTGGERSLEEWLQERMDALRRDLQGDEASQDEPLPAEDLTMLTLVVNDALEGVDITRRYPTFYRRLLAKPHLRQIFLDAMDLLAKSEAGELEPLPEEVDVDLSFLAAEETQDEAQDDEAGHEEGNPSPAARWRVVVARTRRQLRALFAPPPAAAPVRSALAGMEDDYVTLIRDDVATEQGDFELILEGRRPAAANDLHLLLMLVPRGEGEVEAGLEATLRWGTYEETEPVDARGRATFPPLSLDAVLDEGGDVRAGLELRLAG